MKKINVKRKNAAHLCSTTIEKLLFKVLSKVLSLGTSCGSSKIEITRTETPNKFIFDFERKNEYTSIIPSLYFSYLEEIDYDRAVHFIFDGSKNYFKEEIPKVTRAGSRVLVEINTDLVSHVAELKTDQLFEIASYFAALNPDTNVDVIENYIGYAKKHFHYPNGLVDLLKKESGLDSESIETIHYEDENLKVDIAYGFHVKPETKVIKKYIHNCFEVTNGIHPLSVTESYIGEKNYNYYAFYEAFKSTSIIISTATERNTHWSFEEKSSLGVKNEFLFSKLNTLIAGIFDEHLAFHHEYSRLKEKFFDLAYRSPFYNLSREILLNSHSIYVKVKDSLEAENFMLTLCYINHPKKNIAVIDNSNIFTCKIPETTDVIFINKIENLNSRALESIFVNNKNARYIITACREISPFYLNYVLGNNLYEKIQKVDLEFLKSLLKKEI